MDEIKSLTPRANQVIALGQRIARDRGHESVNSLHLLYGIARLADMCVAAKVLQAHFEISSEALRLALEGLFESKPKHDRNVPFSPDAEEVFQLALHEKRFLNHDYIGTEAILLGILRSQCLARTLLEPFHLDLEMVREKILCELDPTRISPDLVVEALTKSAKV